MPLKIKSLLYSLISGFFLVVFWVYINQMKTEANLPISEIMDFINENDAETQRENIEFANTDIKPVSTPTEFPDTNTPVSIPISIPDTNTPISIPVKTPVKKKTGNVIGGGNVIRGGQYKDGDYQATSPTPWGDISIDISVVNGRWNKIQYLQIPDSPPSQYAASYLAKQAIAAQGASIDGVSGATYIAEAFRDDLIQIVQQSKI